MVGQRDGGLGAFLAVSHPFIGKERNSIFVKKKKEFSIFSMEQDGCGT